MKLRSPFKSLPIVSVKSVQVIKLTVNYFPTDTLQLILLYYFEIGNYNEKN